MRKFLCIAPRDGFTVGKIYSVDKRGDVEGIIDNNDCCRYIILQSIDSGHSSFLYCLKEITLEDYVIEAEKL